MGSYSLCPGSLHIMTHPFFASIDWEKLERKEITPPWKPEIADNMDTAYFDERFTSEPVSPTYQSASYRGGSAGLRHFDGFTYWQEDNLNAEANDGDISR